MTPFILIHEGLDDYRLGETINAGLDKALPIIWHEDPMVSKGILGACDGVIASRYHALVSALSQGVPCLGTSWSHKYHTLFENYDCPEALLSSSINDDDLDKKLALLVDEKQRVDLARNIRLQAGTIKKSTLVMWGDVIAALKD